MTPDISSKLAALRHFARQRRQMGGVNDEILSLHEGTDREARLMLADIEVLADVADAASWYLRCVDDVRAHKSVRAFDEAESALRSQLEKLGKLP